LAFEGDRAIHDNVAAISHAQGLLEILLGRPEIEVLLDRLTKRLLLKDQRVLRKTGSGVP
jgi:hypothetical protein